MIYTAEKHLHFFSVSQPVFVALTKHRVWGNLCFGTHTPLRVWLTNCAATKLALLRALGQP